MKKNIVGSFWLISSATMLSLAWLLPNHTPPWLSFHSDAWAATLITLIGLWIVIKSKVNCGWNILTLAVGFCVLMPWVQYFFGQISVFGNAWITSLYALGLLCALKVGEKWQTESPGQVFDFIFIAVTIATIISVGIQLRQWAGMDSLGFWTLRAMMGSRYYANIAQPNLLASLELLGLIGCSWALYRNKIGVLSSLFIACFILLGVVLTESRTAFVNLFLLLILVFFNRKKLPNKNYLWALFGLISYFILTTYFVAFLNAENGSLELRNPAVSERIVAWKMFFEASLQNPIFGFGWGQVLRAYFLVAGHYPSQNGLFSQSHNLFLDLVLWNGYPIGLVLIGIIFWWSWKVFFSLRTFEQLHGVAFTLVLVTHAMLEFPLQYAAFLLPLGLVIGSLNKSLELKVIFKDKQIVSILLLILSSIMLCITIRDYFRVEVSNYGLRFQHYKIETNIPAVPPDVISLTQFHDVILFSRNVPKRNLKDEELQWMINRVEILPSPLLIYNLAVNLTLNNREDEAKKWIILLCKTAPEVNCDDMRALWAEKSVLYPELSKMDWPVKNMIE